MTTQINHQSLRFKRILLFGTLSTLIVAIGWTYLNLSNEDSLLSWEFVLSFVYIFFLIYLSILGTTIFFGGIFLIMSVLFDTDFIDDWLLFKVRKHRTIWLWSLLILFLAFCTIIGILLIRPWFGSPEFKEMADYFIKLLLLGESIIFGLIVIVLAGLKKPLKLSSTLAEKVSPELIVRYPKSAVKEAFVFFEDRLRQKLNLPLEKDKKKPSAIDLINLAFAKGHLKHSKSEENRNLMAGIIGKYRNPLSHESVDVDEQTATMILFLIDDFVRVVDESERVEPNQST